MLGAIFLFGYNAIAKFREKQCEAEFYTFVNDLEATIEELSRRAGAVEEKTYPFSCQIGKIYFIDISKEMDDDFIDDFPIMGDSVESGAKENMFLMKDGEIVNNFYIGEISIVPPYYNCFKPAGDQIEMLLQGEDGKVLITHLMERYSCGPTRVREVTGEKVNNTIEEIYNKLGDTDFLDEDEDGNVDEDDYEKIMNNYKRTEDYVDITREFKKTNDDKTKVIIRINPKPGITLDEFNYIEEITKECLLAVFGVTDITLTGFMPTDTDPVYDEVIPDPLIMWHLGNTDITHEERIQYIINSPEFDELCRELLSGMGWSKGVSSIMGP